MKKNRCSGGRRSSLRGREVKERIETGMRVEWSLRRSKLKRKAIDLELSEVAREIGELEDLLRIPLDFC